ncbi:MAG: hypothetical protein CW338_05000 [Clostridiales bacterium]|nr:hypothetical protein [Clostridiales bacterium]
MIQENDMLSLGFSETDITPKKPSRLVGFYRPDDLSKGVLQPLTAQAAVWEEKEKYCLITIDSIGFTKELSDALRNKVSRLLGTTADHVMLCFSHTHSAPDADIERGYWQYLCEKVEAAVSAAANSMAPVSAGWANASAHIGINRRPVSKVTDDRVGILKICDADTDELKLLILRVTAHGNVLKRDNCMVSPDYFGAVRKTISSLYNCPVMMIQGAAGNIAPRYFCSKETPVDARMDGCVRSDTALQDMADAIADGVSGVINSISMHPAPAVRMYSRHIELTAPVPSIEEAERVEREAKDLCGIENPGWIGKVKELLDAGITEQTEDVEMQYFSIGGWCICGGPYEFMAGFALETRKQLQDEYFYLNGYTNGCLLYFPTEDEFDYGGYEVYWSMLIYYIYIDRVFPFYRNSASELIDFVVKNKGL